MQWFDGQCGLYYDVKLCSTYVTFVTGNFHKKQSTLQKKTLKPRKAKNMIKITKAKKNVCIL